MRIFLTALTALLCAAPARTEDAAQPPRPRATIKTNHGEIVVELYPDEAPKTVANFLGLAAGTKAFKDSKTGEMIKRPFYDGLIFHRVIAGFMLQAGCPLGNGRGNPGFSFEDEINALDLGLDKKKVVQADGRPSPGISQREIQIGCVQPLMKKLGMKDNAQLQARQAEFMAEVRKLSMKQFLENVGYRYNETRKSHPPIKGSLAMANAGPNTNGSQFFINLVDTPHLAGKHTVFGHVVKGMDIVQKIGKVAVDSGSKPREPVKILSIRPVGAAKPAAKKSD